MRFGIGWHAAGFILLETCHVRVAPRAVPIDRVQRDTRIFRVVIEKQRFAVRIDKHLYSLSRLKQTLVGHRQHAVFHDAQRGFLSVSQRKRVKAAARSARFHRAGRIRRQRNLFARLCKRQSCCKRHACRPNSSPNPFHHAFLSLSVYKTSECKPKFHVPRNFCLFCFVLKPALATFFSEFPDELKKLSFLFQGIDSFFFIPYSFFPTSRCSNSPDIPSPARRSYGGGFPFR